jgi:hypothetical protein
MLPGQRITSAGSNLQITCAKYSKSAGALEDFPVTSDEEEVSAIFPLSSASQPSDSQVLAAMIFRSSHPGLEDPTGLSKAGPFKGQETQHQKILSNHTLYLSYRDEDGSYLAGDQVFSNTSSPDSLVELSFKMNITDYIKQVFLDRN